MLDAFSKWLHIILPFLAVGRAVSTGASPYWTSARRHAFHAIHRKMKGRVSAGERVAWYLYFHVKGLQAADPAGSNGNGREDVAELTKPVAKQRPIFVVNAVSLLASETSDGKVHQGQLGQYLKRTDPAFSPKAYGHSGLLEMLKTYDFLVTQRDASGGWSVSLTPH